MATWIVQSAGFVSLAVAAALYFTFRHQQARIRTQARCRLWHARLYSRRLVKAGNLDLDTPMRNLRKALLTLLDEQLKASDN